MKRMMLIVMALVGAASLAGCNTMEGVGKDVTKGGQAIERAAK